MSLLLWLRRLDTLATRRGRRHVLVDSRTPLNFEMVAPVLHAMAPDTRVRFAFTASEEPQRLSRIYRTAPSGTSLITPKAAALRRWDAYLTSDFLWATLPRGTARIQMFHGVAGKYRFDAPTTSMRMWDRLFFVNERRFRNFVAAGAIDANSPAARVIGMPKVDCLVDGSLRRDAVLAAAGLDPSLPTVLYAPTWSPASSLNLLGVPLLERLVQLPVNVVVKLHDRSLDRRPEYSGGVDWTAVLASVLRGPRARLAEGANIAPWLVAADLLISDHSSAAFEYLILDRPLVRIEVPELLERAQVHPDYINLLKEGAETVRDVDGTLDAVERAMADPRSRSAARRRIAADLFYRPGTATARCADALYDVLELEPHPQVIPHRHEATACVSSA